MIEKTITRLKIQISRKEADLDILTNPIWLLFFEGEKEEARKLHQKNEKQILRLQSDIEGLKKEITVILYGKK